MVKNQTFNYSIAEEDAVITAHLNEYACNPVLRGQADATLHYFSQLVLCNIYYLLYVTSANILSHNNIEG